MHKRMTITLDQAVYDGLVEDLLRPHVVDRSIDSSYRAMAADGAREAEATEWCNGLAGDMADAAR